MVFDTNSSSLKKNQSISPCRILAVSYGSLSNATCVCTALYHSSTLLSPCLKLVSKSNLALTSLDWGFKKSSNFFQYNIYGKLFIGKIPRHTLINPKIPTPGIHFLAFPSLCKHYKLTIQYIFIFQSPL